MLTKADIKYTIGALAKAGKRLPRDPNGGQMDIDDLVEVWHHVFQNTELPTWQKAMTKVLTMTEARGLDLNVINTALMMEALKRVQEYELANRRKEDEALKTADILKEAENNTLSRPMRIALHWTRRRLRLNQKPLNVPGADAEAVIRYGKKLGMTSAEFKEQNRLIRIYLADVAYFKRQNKTPGYEIYIGEDRLLHSRKEAMA